MYLVFVQKYQKCMTPWRSLFPKRVDWLRELHAMISVTWAADVARAPIEVRETALAHAGDKVVQAYMRSDFLAERRALMAQWEEFCLIGSNVTPLRGVG
jgi:hypothetical protein